MDVRTRTASAPDHDLSSGDDVVALAPSRRAEIVTRRELTFSKPSGSQRVVPVATPRSDAVREGGSLVTRRYGMIRSRRKRQVLTVVAVMLAIFPPMWAVYLIAWVVWRNRPRQESLRLVRRAVRSLERNQTGSALKELQDAHFRDPSNTDALYWLGLVLSQQQRQEEAEEALSLVAERVPGLPEVESALVDAYVSMDEPESAIYHAQRLFDAQPYAPEALLKLADAFEAAGRLDLAIDALKQAPLHKRTLSGALVEIHFRLGALLERQGDVARALHHYNRVYARDITYQDVQARVQALRAGHDL